jgi:hypothetical protein
MTAFHSINNATNTVFTPWFALLAPLPDWLQISVTALPVTLFALLVFRVASNQAGITRAKDLIKAHLLELWLYKDDPGVLLRAQGRVAFNSLAYLGHSLVPLALMIVPVGLLVAQLEAQYAFRALAPGESAIVTVTTRTALPAPAATLALPPGIVAETPALRVADRGAVLWRLRGDAAGEHIAGITVDGMRVERRIAVGTGRAMPTAYAADDWRSLGYPSEAPLPAGSAITAVEVEYPRARGEFLGLSSASWLLLGATLVLGFALRGAFRVTF